MTSFNLLDEPWIQVVTTDGDNHLESLHDVFAHAQSIRDIRGDIATQDAAVLRLLLAISHRALDGPENIDAWQEIWQDPDQLTTAAHDYLEDYRDRFDLFHRETPFFQVPGLETTSGKSSPLSSLIIDVPNGAPFFSMRHTGGLERLTHAEAARWLVHAHAFDPSGIRSGVKGDPTAKGGKSYPIGPGWSGQIGLVIVEGHTLFETIMRNLIPLDNGSDILPVQDEDLPPWEREPDPPHAVADRDLAGPVSCYTWQTRRIRLVSDGEAVTSVIMSNGDKATPQNRFDVEPMTAWRFSMPQTKKAGHVVYMPREHRAERAFWRNLTAVLPGLPERLKVSISRGNSAEVAASRQPAVVSFQTALSNQRIIPRDGLARLHAVGFEYGAQQAVVTELIDARLEIPATLFDPGQEALLALVNGAIEDADAAAYILKRLAMNLATSLGGAPDTVDAAGVEATRSIYACLDGLFPSWLTTLTLGTAETVTDRRLAWRRTLRAEATSLGEALIDAAPSTAVIGRSHNNSLMDLGHAARFFTGSLRKALPLPEDTPTTTNKKD